MVQSEMQHCGTGDTTKLPNNDQVKCGAKISPTKTFILQGVC